MTPELEGLEIVYPQMRGEKIDIKLEAGQEHLILMRRYDGKCRYSTSYLTHKRRLTVDEMMKMAKDAEEKT